LERAHATFHTLLARRSLPLGGITTADDDFSALVGTPPVVALLASQTAFLQRLYAYYGNDSRDATPVTVFLPEFLAFAADFDLTPRLLNRGDVEAVFFGCARRAGTDLS